MVVPSGKVSENRMYYLSMVCFCDIPIADIGIHARKYSSFGLSFRKSFLVEQRANPVFYISRNSIILSSMRLSPKDLIKGKKETLGEAFDYVLPKLHERIYGPSETDKPGRDEDEESLWSLYGFLEDYVFNFLKVFDPSKDDDDSDNFYMEREWRMRGNLTFELDNVSRKFCRKAFLLGSERSCHHTLGRSHSWMMSLEEKSILRRDCPV